MALIVFLAFLLGTFIGSFLNVVTQRLPKCATLGGRSACANCGRVLGLLDLIPVISFIALGGKCRTCKVEIHWRYLAMELVCGGLFAMSAWLYPPLDGLLVVKFLLSAIVCSVGLVTFVVDFEHFIILDRITVVGSVLAFICVIVLDTMSGQGLFSRASLSVRALLGVACGMVPFFILWFVSGGKWLGFGDVKYMLFFGLTLGYPLVIVGLLFSFWLGALVSLPLLVLGRKQLTSRLPFGTFLVLGQITTLMYGPVFLHWYLRLIGF